MIFSLVYSSTTDHDWSQVELVDLLTWSRGWNVDHGITGLLLYRDCVFMQVLEGAEADVRELFSHIVVDKRHQDVDLMWEHEASGRKFADWSMGFRELRGHPVVEPGYSDTLNGPHPRGHHDRPDVVSDFWSMFRAEGLADDDLPPAA